MRNARQGGRFRVSRFTALAIPWLVATAAALVTTGVVVAKDRGKDGGADRAKELRFAAEMAAQGLWREALFHWELLLKVAPDDPYILNNVGVAREALGDRQGARAAYARAVALKADPKIRSNQALFLRVERPAEDASPAAPDEATPPPAEVKP